LSIDRNILYISHVEDDKIALWDIQILKLIKEKKIDAPFYLTFVEMKLGMFRAGTNELTIFYFCSSNAEAVIIINEKMKFNGFYTNIKNYEKLFYLLIK
jgi:hypothetical protein